MALDHYVPQVHLRQFNSPALQGKKLYGIRKRDLFVFPCSSKDVCRVEEGSTNPYLAEARSIEDFLKTVEPFYSRALNVLRSGRTDQRSVYTVAGFIAYVATCSPTAIRLQTKPLEGSVDLTAELLERHGELPLSVVGVLRQGAGFRNGGSGSAGLEVERPARDAASGGWRGCLA
jgi:hypothetical protein